MATTKATKTPTSSRLAKPTKTAAKATLEPVPDKVPVLSVPSPEIARLASTARRIREGAQEFELVTSLNLRRSIIPDAKDPFHLTLYITNEDHRALSRAGIGYGVTADELLRGLIAQERAAQNPFANLKNYLPASTD